MGNDKFIKEVKAAVNSSGQGSFRALEKEIHGERTGHLSDQVKQWGAKLSKVLSLIGYDLVIRKRPEDG